MSSKANESGQLKAFILLLLALLSLLGFSLLYSYLTPLVLLMSLAGAMAYLSWARISNTGISSPDYIQSGEAGTLSLVLLLLFMLMPSFPLVSVLISFVVLFIMEYILFMPSSNNNRSQYLVGIVVLFILGIFVFYMVREDIFPGPVLTWAPFLGFSDVLMSPYITAGITGISLIIYLVLLTLIPEMKLLGHGKPFIELTGVRYSVVFTVLAAARALLIILLLATMGWIGVFLKYFPRVHRSPTPANEIIALSMVILYLAGANLLVLFFPAGIVLAVMVFTSYILTCSYTHYFYHRTGYR